MLIVSVKMVVGKSDYHRFKPLLLSNAEISLKETGCSYFSVAENQNEGSGEYAFLLYEEYSDRAAFNAHLQTEHFLSFDAKTAEMLLSKDVQFYDLIQK